MAAIFISHGKELLLHDLTSPSHFLVRDFYSNIYEVDRSHFRVFLRDQVSNINAAVISRIIWIP